MRVSNSIESLNCFHFLPKIGRIVGELVSTDKRKVSLSHFKRGIKISPTEKKAIRYIKVTDKNHLILTLSLAVDEKNFFRYFDNMGTVISLNG